MPDEDKKLSIRNKSKFRILGILGILLFAAGVIISGFVIKHEPQVLGLSAQSEITSLISQVGKLIVLPSNELPTVTSISDVTKLSDQPFFKNAKNGDKLLVYTNTKWGIIYRPSENRIIEVGAFDVSQPAPASPVAPTITPTPAPTATPAPTPSASPASSTSPSPLVSPTASPAATPVKP
jgi:hypothetical protein